MAGDRGVSACMLCLKENKLSLYHLLPETSPLLRGRMPCVLVLCVVVPCADCEVSASFTEAGKILGNKDTACGSSGTLNVSLCDPWCLSKFKKIVRCNWGVRGKWRF